VSWASMIAGYVQHDLCEEALATLEEMQHCNAGSKAMRQRLPIHARVYMSGSSDDISIWNTLVYLYARCGRSEEAFFLSPASHLLMALHNNMGSHPRVSQIKAK
jgi:pentatricopeptide repeat protein